MAYIFADQIIDLDEEITLKVQELCASGLPPVDSYTKAQIDAKIDDINQVPEFTSSDANKVLAVNSAGTDVEWATSGGGGGGGVNPPSADDFNFQSYWYLSSDDPTSIKWNASGITQFNYFSALDNYASEWDEGSLNLTSDLTSGAEAEYLVVLPTPNDMVNNVWTSPYAMSNYQSTPTYLRLNGFSISSYSGALSISQKTVINDIYSSSNPILLAMGSILGAEESQIWNTVWSYYNSNPTIQQTKIIYLTDYDSNTYRVEHVKIKNVGSTTLLSGTPIITNGKPIKMMPTCAVYSEYTPV